NLLMGQSVVAKDNPKKTIALSLAKIDAMLVLSDADLPSLDLTSTRIRGDLLLANARWQEGAELRLYNTEVVGMQDVSQASFSRFWLEGFTYSRLAELPTATLQMWWDRKPSRTPLTRRLETFLHTRSDRKPSRTPLTRRLETFLHTRS